MDTKRSPPPRNVAGMAPASVLLALLKGRGAVANALPPRGFDFLRARGRPFPFSSPSLERGDGAPGGARGLRGPLGVCETPLADPLRRELPARLGRAQRGPPPGMRDPSDVGASASRRSTVSPRNASRRAPLGRTGQS